MKNAIVIFSAEGNTRHASEELSKIIGCPVFEIKPTIPYSAQDLNWRDRHSRSSVEMQDEGSRPGISPIDITGYDRLFIGFPIWWGVEPRVVDTFLDSCPLQGKEVYVFATSGGSPIDAAVAHIRALYPDMKIIGSNLLNFGVEEGDFAKYK